MAPSLGIYSVPFQGFQAPGPLCAFPPASEAAKATLKAKEAEEQGSCAVVCICTNKISYHECFGCRWRKQDWGRWWWGGASSQLRSPPLLSVLSAVCLDKTQLLPSICMLAQPLCLGPGWTPARTVLLPFSPWEVQLKCAEVLPVTLSLDTTTASSGTHGPLQLSSPCLRFSLIQWPTMTCFHVRVLPRPQSIQTHTHTHTTTLSWELF